MRLATSVLLVGVLLLLTGCGPRNGGTAQAPNQPATGKKFEPQGPVEPDEKSAANAAASAGGQADDPASIAALEKMGAELTRNEQGRVASVAFPKDADDAALKSLRGLPAVREVALAWSKITDDGLEQLATLEHLETLDVSSTAISDVGLEHLSGLKNLKMVMVEGSDVTIAGVKQLRESLPQLFVQMDAAGIAPSATPRRPDEPPVDDKSPAGQFRTIVAERDAAMQKLADAYQTAPTDDDRKKLLADYAWDTPFAKRALQLVQENPKDRVAFEALAWILNAERGEGIAALKAQAVAALKDGGHLESPRIFELFETLPTQPSKAGEQLLRAALERKLPVMQQAQATYALAKTLMGLADAAAQLAGMTAEEREQLEQRSGKDAVEALAGDPAALRKEAEELFQQVIDKFAKAPNVGPALAEAAKGDLFEMKHLSIGAEAPEIEGRDIDGNTLKLSAYRGRVVVLDFWGHW